MPVIIQHSRGDIRKRQTEDLKNGQFFWSYINTDPFNPKGNSFSRGQLWVKDPSSQNFTEIADRRSLDSLCFKGYINPNSFNGDFINSKDIDFCRCHKGDFWIFEKTDKEHYQINNENVCFFKSDILIITDTVYEDVKNHTFPDKLTSVKYIRIPGTLFEKEDSDLEADAMRDAILELEQRLLYKGEIQNYQEFSNLKKGKGWLYIFTNPVWIKTSQVDLPLSRQVSTENVKTKRGDFIYWNGEKWVLIPSGSTAKDIDYTPNSEEIESVATFSEDHKKLLKETENVQDALDVLNKSKAQLDETGKVPLSQLPEFLQKGLVFEGIFQPINDKNNVENQNEWPVPEEDGTKLNGHFWIVDCLGASNVQYIDKDNPGRIVELNTGDWIVWAEKNGRFEVVDNSDQLQGIRVIYPDLNSEKFEVLKGIVDITAEGNLKVRLSDNTIIIGEKTASLRSDPDAMGKKNYFSKFKDQTTLIPGSMFQAPTGDNRIITEVGFQVGQPKNKQIENVYGDVIIRKTPGTQNASGLSNSELAFDTFFYNTEEQTAERWTTINASMRRNLAKNLLEDTVHLTLPEASSLLVGILADEELAPNYIPKTTLDGFISDSLNSEIAYMDEYLKENYEEGYLNVGYGRTASEDIDTGEITFYAKSKDKINEYQKYFGFYTSPHSNVDDKDVMSEVTEHFLNREKLTSRTHLVINPYIISQTELENFVKMPRGSGTLLLWEDFFMFFGNPGIPLMIPVWEHMHYAGFDFVGLSNSPITIKINRPKKDPVDVDRTNDLAKNYGPGDKSTWSYISSSKKGSLQDKLRGNIDDVVSFDSWLEAQRSIATKEAFILPSTSTTDSLSTQAVSTTNEITKDPNEKVNDAYGKDRAGGAFQRILPSRTLYKDDSTYYDWHTGELIPQNTTDKDVEMPAVGGVLLTTKSRIDCGIYLS